MIQRTYEQALKAKRLNQVVVATDDQRIFDHIVGFGGNVVMTSPNHATGTERCAEVAQREEMRQYSVIVNIQGDEPAIDPEQINLLAELFNTPSTKLATLIRPSESRDDHLNPNIVKVVLTKNLDAIYFSRAPIPFRRETNQNSNTENFLFYQHIGIYGYEKKTLLEIAGLDPTPCESAEALEQLRWLENGYKIAANISNHKSYSIDTPEDLQKVASLFNDTSDE